MCFYIHPKHPSKKIANRDIVCYKCLWDNFRSPHQCKFYKLNKLYRSPITIDTLWDFTITRGLHSYSYKRFAIRQMGYNGILVKGIIPKGSKYYYNPDRHEYVSNQIILQEIIK
jgi:hypothetical protein